MTSIGLDGEEIDQVTFQEKPRIFAKKGFLIASAKETLNSFEAEYDILEETKISTPIGNVIILKITKPGNVLVAGPSIISDMMELIKLIEKYGPEKILIDGAFFRHSTAKLSQATILVIGANLSATIVNVVNNARIAIKKFKLPEFENKNILSEKTNICIIQDNGNLKELEYKSLLGKVKGIFTEDLKNAKYVFFPRALTNDFAKELVIRRKEFHFDIIVNSPVNIQLDEKNLDNIFKINSRIFVIDSVNLIAVCYNPTSPRGYRFQDQVFKEKLSKLTELDVINVKEEKSYE